MSAQGTLNSDGLTVAQITIDLLQNPAKVHALAALTNSKTGQTLAWAQGDGGVWSTDTMEKLRELREAMEEDLARALFAEHSSVNTRPNTKGVKIETGLGEHVGGGADAPSI